MEIMTEFQSIYYIFEENVGARPALKKAKRPSVISIAKLPDSQGGSFSEDLLSMASTQPSQIVEESPEIKLKEESEPPENSYSEDSEQQPVHKPRKRLPTGKFIRLRTGNCLYRFTILKLSKSIIYVFRRLFSTQKC